jgi:hypothetical protein
MKDSEVLCTEGSPFHKWKWMISPEENEEEPEKEKLKISSDEE